MNPKTNQMSHLQQGRYSSYRCVNGCIHVVAGNVMITLSQEQFLNFAQAIDNFLQTIEPESEAFSRRSYCKSVVM